MSENDRAMSEWMKARLQKSLVCECGWWIYPDDEAMHKHDERMARQRR